jgi:hypothetical protein
LSFILPFLKLNLFWLSSFIVLRKFWFFKFLPFENLGLKIFFQYKNIIIAYTKKKKKTGKLDKPSIKESEFIIIAGMYATSAQNKMVNE